MTAHARNALLPAFTLIGIAAPLGAVADVTVQEQTTVNVSNLKAHSLATHRISGDKERSETEDGHVDIVRLDRGVTWTVDPKKKRYTEIPFPTAQQRRAAAESCPVPRPTPAIDTAKCELTAPKLTVDKTDEVATLAGYSAQRTNLKLIQNCKTQDPNQACVLTYSFDVWLTLDQVPGGYDQSAFRRRSQTQLGVGQSSVATSAPVRQYLAPYAGAMQQLAEKSNELKGYSLKTTFRVGFSGAPCGAGTSRTASVAPGAVSDAASAATAATASSAEHAAGWGTADAVARSTGSSVGGYVAGSAAGAFTGRLIGGLFAKKPKADPKPASAVPESVPVTILAEVTTETTSLSADTIPAAQFELPPGWTKLAANPNGDPLACHPRN